MTIVNYKILKRSLRKIIQTCVKKIIKPYHRAIKQHLEKGDANYISGWEYSIFKGIQLSQIDLYIQFNSNNNIDELFYET